MRNAEKLLKEHPKVAKKILDWLAKEMHDEAAANIDYAVAILGLAPRILYDFFDEEDLWIAVSIQANHMWTHIIEKGYETMITEFDYPSRTEAEEAAFIKAIEILENVENTDKDQEVASRDA